MSGSAAAATADALMRMVMMVMIAGVCLFAVGLSVCL